MIYTTGTIAIRGNTLTGTGTNFTAAGSLIRNGCTVIALTSQAQVFQITAIGGATSLTVTPAANPAIPAGTKYAILLSDSLSVDGLAQDIAETFTMYQRYMSGFADVMNGTSDVTITINGTAVTVPGQKSLAKKGANSDITSLSGLTTALSISQGGTGATNAADARKNLDLGDSATRSVGTVTGTVAAGDDSRITGALQKTGGTLTGQMNLKSAPIAADANSVISANGGLDVDLSKGFILKGRVQQGASRDNNILTISGDGDTPTTGYVGAFKYNWYADGWIAGITRGSGTNTIAYSIYYNGASYGTGSKLWSFNYDGSATSQGAWVNGSDER
ncbi:tail fiber domain-containing protein, partial [Enterobacter cloacae]|uniref:tail fiber domain-containing protein n=1 Tax=Enterobacter cloacae TaxID=550 RepID=UPI002448D34C